MHPISRTSCQGMGHGMMTSSNGNIFRVTGHLCGEFTGDKGQWGGALVFPLICARINSWVSNREASDLRRHRAQYDVIVMGTGRLMHYTNVIWALWRFTSSVTQPIVQQIVLASIRRNIKASHYRPFARGNHGCPVDDPHKEPVCEKRHDVIVWPHILRVHSICTHLIRICEAHSTSWRHYVEHLAHPSLSSSGARCGMATCWKAKEQLSTTGWTIWWPWKYGIVCIV